MRDSNDTNINTNYSNSDYSNTNQEQKILKWTVYIKGKLLVPLLNHQLVNKADTTTTIPYTNTNNEAKEQNEQTISTPARLFSDYEQEEVVLIILFTHLFDCIAISFHMEEIEDPNAENGNESI